MHSYAQTNIQLLNQLSSEGYSNAELEDVFHAYQLTMKLFTGQFRASGKTFIAHLVGTASILARLHLSSHIVSAGLLHAAYAQGDFGGIGKREISPDKQRLVRQIVGDKTEEYIARYTRLVWNNLQIASIHQNIGLLDSRDREVLLIRLANELEEYLDCGIVYCGDTKYRQYIQHQKDLIVEIAEKLGYPTLAAELTATMTENLLAEIPSTVQNATGHTHSSHITPNSYQRKLPVWFYQTLGAKIGRKLNF